MEPIRFRCRHCGATLKAPVRLAGKELSCPKCSRLLTVPVEAAEAVGPSRGEPGAAAGGAASEAGAAAGMKLCPYCQEPILATAVKCRHCGEFLEGGPARRPRSAAAEIPEGELTPAEYVVATLFCPFGLLIALYWYMQKAAKARRMLQISGLTCVIAGVGIFLGVNVLRSQRAQENPLKVARFDPAVPLPSLPQIDPLGPRVVIPKLEEQENLLGAPPQESELAQQPPEIQRALRANVTLKTDRTQGSGVIVQFEGGEALVLTNRHVVDIAFARTRGAQPTAIGRLPELTVTYVTADREKGKVIWLAPDGVDLALVRARRPPQGVQEAQWQPFPTIRQGEDVFAVGNPAGLGWTYTKGVVSAMRQTKSGQREVPVVQTDAAINPGNSGGGLYNAKGLIGINNFIINPLFAQNVGFALRTTVLQELGPEPLRLEGQDNTPMLEVGGRLVDSLAGLGDLRQTAAFEFFVLNRSVGYAEHSLQAKQGPNGPVYEYRSQTELRLPAEAGLSVRDSGTLTAQFRPLEMRSEQIRFNINSGTKSVVVHMTVGPDKVVFTKTESGQPTATTEVAVPQGPLVSAEEFWLGRLSFDKNLTFALQTLDPDEAKVVKRTVSVSRGSDGTLRASISADGGNDYSLTFDQQGAWTGLSVGSAAALLGKSVGPQRVAELKKTIRALPQPPK